MGARYDEVSARIERAEDLTRLVSDSYCGGRSRPHAKEHPYARASGNRRRILLEL